jgi:hypothetical protein
VGFYGRISEIAISAQIAAGAPDRQTSEIQANDVILFVEVWVDICNLARWIIADWEVRKEFDKAVKADILSQIDEIITETRNNFPELREDVLEQALSQCREVARARAQI